MRYVVIVSGRNIIVGDDFKKSLGPRLSAAPSLGCFTTRIVTASSTDEACRIAIASARKELENSEVQVSNNSSDPPVFEVEEVSEENEYNDKNIANKGFTFYAEEKNIQ